MKTSKKMPSKDKPRISLCGVFLDEMQTRVLVRGKPDAVAFMSMPAEHHACTIDGDVVTLRVPAVTLLQLAFDGRIAKGRECSLVIGGVVDGMFVVEDLLRLDGFELGEPMILRLKRA